MPIPIDPHNPQDWHDNLTLMALGETVDADFTQHQESCLPCRAELTALTTTVQLARGSSRETAASLPPARVWDAIEAAVTPKSTRIFRPSRPVSSRFNARRLGSGGIGSRWLGAWRLGLATAMIALAVGIGGFVVGRNTHASTQSVAAHAVLTARRGGPNAVTGTAEVTQNSTGYTVSVTTHSLPIRDGYYAVWVYAPAINNMINIGALNANGTGRFSLPPGVQISDYNVIDVSAQNFDGNPAHQQSVLQGPLTK